MPGLYLKNMFSRFACCRASRDLSFETDGLMILERDGAKSSIYISSVLIVTSPNDAACALFFPIDVSHAEYDSYRMLRGLRIYFSAQIF